MQAARSEEKLKKLQADRESMTVKVADERLRLLRPLPAGQIQRAPTLAETLRRGGNLQPNQVFMTVVEAAAAFLRAA